MRISKQDMVMGGMSPLPEDTYTVRCIEATKAMSKGNNGKTPKLCAYTKWEIISPAEVVVGGTRYAAAGRSFKPMPHVLDASVPYGTGALVQALERGGFDFNKFEAEGDFDDDRIGALVGFTCQMTLRTEESFKTRVPNADELAEGTPPATRIPVLDGNGDPVSNGHYIQARLTDIVAPVSENGIGY